MQVRLLGDVDAVGDRGEVSIPGVRRRSVLATLALRPGELVSVDRIVDAVWGEDPPTTARNTVQVHVAYLRRAMAVPNVIVGRSPGYVLSIPSPATDVVAVDELLARAAVASGPAERLPLLERAAGHWRSASLGGVGESTYLARHAFVLDQLRLTTTERLLADHLRLGHHEDVLGRVSLLVAEQPDRDRPTQLLMTALYRCGRSADALEAYRRLQTAQRESLVTAPGPPVQALRDQISRADPQLRVPVRSPAPAVRRPAVEVVGTLRRPLSRLIGREAELDRVRSLLRRSRLVTVVGMGGVGKTRLALEVARDRGVATHVDVVDLTSAAPHPADVARLVASVLAVRADDGQAPMDALVCALGGTGRLLVLDNCEHVLWAVSTVLAELLDRLPHLRILATSREPLHLEGEECLLLDPLAIEQAGSAPTPSPAMAMLLDRARSADPAYDPNEAAVAVLEELCRRVDGLPLALEILGPRLRSLTAHELAEGIGSHLLSWRDQRRSTSERHRSIGSLMEWSYGLLDEAETRALDQLSLLRGGGWLVEAADLCGDEHRSGEDVILTLVDRSLVARSETEGRSRVSVHPLVQAYAASRLAAFGASHAAAERHAHWVESLITKDAEYWHGPEETRRLRWRTLDAGNVNAALEWRRDHNPSGLSTMVAALWWWWYRSGEATAGYGWARAAVDAGPDDRTAARAHLATGYLAWLVDEYPAARHHATTALHLSTDPAVVGFARGILSRVCGDEGDFEGAVDHARSSIAEFQDARDTWAVAWSRRCLAAALRYAGRPEEGDAVCPAALDTFRRLGDGWGLAGALATSAMLQESMGRLSAARVLGTEAVDAHRAIEDPSGERRALQQLALICWSMEAIEDAASYATASLILSERHGYLVGALQALLLLEDVERSRGDTAAAESLASGAAALSARLGPRADLSLALARGRRHTR